jgi:uncharacterized protein (TIGR03437 family)
LYLKGRFADSGFASLFGVRLRRISMRKTLGVLVVVCASLGPLQAQTGQAPGRVLSAGYSVPGPLRASPGQVITLYVHATPGTRLERRIAAGQIPLPVALGGYSVTLEQTLYTDPLAVPIFAVEPVTSCYGVSPTVCIEMTAVTIQVPWELVPNRPRSARPENFGILTVSYQGTKGEAVALQPEVDDIHIINSCDYPAPPGIELPEQASGPCRPLVTHSDGRLVTPANPAAAGETLLFYAFGLGKAEGDLRTGDAVQDAAAFTDIEVGFQNGLNLAPNRPPSSAEQEPITGGLINGQVGLYRIAITIPAVPAGTRECTASTIESNLTVSIGRQQSYSGAGICVKP